MTRIQLNELTAFVAVAERSSFTKAAAQVGIALPTMSQTIRSLEEGLGVRLFNRTTRSVALTEAGDRLLAEVQPILDGIDHAVESVNAFRDKPIGTLRLAIDRSASQILTARGFTPLIQPFLAEYPGIRVEISIDEAAPNHYQPTATFKFQQRSLRPGFDRQWAVLRDSCCNASA